MSDSGRRRPDDEDASEPRAPAYGKAVPDRFSSDEVFQRIVSAADEEVTCRLRELFFSGVAAGFAISITFLVYASMSATADSKVVGAMLYPLGFIYIIIGGYQLYTENTLPPVTLVLERLTSVPSLLRHWLTVLAGNFTGGAIGAIVLVYGGVLEPEAATQATALAERGAFETEWWHLFYKAVFAGLIVAGVVWVEYAARDTISRLVVVYLAFLAIPMGDLFHVVVSFTETFYLYIEGGVALHVGLRDFVLPVLLGNTVGGVVLVTLVNYFHTSEERLQDVRFEGVDRRLSPTEWVFGRAVGRSYVPVLDTAESAILMDDSYRVVVPVLNPREDADIVRFACAIASARDKATVHAVHVVQAPENISLIHGDTAQRITETSERLIRDLGEVAEDYDVGFKASTLSTHRSLEEVFDLAKRTRPDLVVMGWGDGDIWRGARAERRIDELTNRLPCDFVVVGDRDLDASSLLLPTAGGTDSDLGGEVACALHDVVDTEVHLLHVVARESERPHAESFLDGWAEKHHLEDAKKEVDTSGDVQGAIKRAAEGHTMVVLGATDKGMLSRLISRALHLEVVEDIDATVVLVERPRERSLRERLFGAGTSASRRGTTPENED